MSIQDRCVVCNNRLCTPQIPVWSYTMSEANWKCLKSNKPYMKVNSHGTFWSNIIVHEQCTTKCEKCLQSCLAPYIAEHKLCLKCRRLGIPESLAFQ